MTVASVLTAHAFLLDGTLLVDAGFLAGGMASAKAVNGSGELVGSGVVPSRDGGLDTRGFHWAAGVMSEIQPAPGNTKTDATDIDDNGWVVGHTYASDVDAPSRGFVWKDGVMVILNDRIPADAGVDIVGAFGIDARGRIAAWGTDLGGKVVAARLTPVPRVAADIDCDGIFDGADLGKLLAAWGDVDAGVADLNGDGIVDAADLGVMLASWNGG